MVITVNGATVYPTAAAADHPGLLAERVVRCRLMKGRNQFWCVAGRGLRLVLQYPDRALATDPRRQWQPRRRNTCTEARTKTTLLGASPVALYSRKLRVSTPTRWELQSEENRNQARVHFLSLSFSGTGCVFGKLSEMTVAVGCANCEPDRLE